MKTVCLRTNHIDGTVGEPSSISPPSIDLRNSQSVSLRHSGQDQDHLHHSKPIADADARPTPERDVSEPWELPGEVAAPTLGTKLRRVLEVPRIAVQHPGADG